MPASKINKDLKDERDKIKFNVDEFTNWFYGGEEKVKEKRFMGKEIKFDLLVKLTPINFFRELLLIR